MSAQWEGVDERAARAAGAWAIAKGRSEGRHGLAHAYTLLQQIAVSALLRDDVATAREYARAAALVEESADRMSARWLRERGTR